MFKSYEGACACQHVRYRLLDRPMIVHACHCYYCQRESGGAFAVNALIENNAIELLCGEPVEIVLPTKSGKGQRVSRCPICQIALFSHYVVANSNVAFVRVGSLDEPHRFPPDVHIHTASKQPWVQLGDDVPIKLGFYDQAKVWSPESLARYAALRGKKLVIGKNP